MNTHPTQSHNRRTPWWWGCPRTWAWQVRDGYVGIWLSDGESCSARWVAPSRECQYSMMWCKKQHCSLRHSAQLPHRPPHRHCSAHYWCRSAGCIGSPGWSIYSQKCIVFYFQVEENHIHTSINRESHYCFQVPFWNVLNNYPHY